MINPPDTENEKETEKKRKKLDSMIKKYINGFMNDIKENGIGTPSGGDCFGCMFVDAEKGIVRGGMHENETMGFDHYIEHFKEGYYVRSLLWKALHEKGYNNPAFIWQAGCLNHHFKRTLQWFFNRRKAELIKHI